MYLVNADCILVTEECVSNSHDAVMVVYGAGRGGRMPAQNVRQVRQQIFIYFLNLYAQHGAQTHDPEIKSHTRRPDSRVWNLRLICLKESHLFKEGPCAI